MPPDDARRHIVGSDPVFASPFPLGEVAATALAACGRAAANLWELRTGEQQDVRVDVGAAAASLLGFAFQSLNGSTPRRTNEGNPFVALYECRDGRWIHLHGTLRPDPSAPTRKVLGLATDVDRDAIASAVKRWDAQALEDALAEASTCGATVRTADEWKAHPQALALEGLARLSVKKIGDAPPEPVGDGIRPLGGVRVLDLTRVLAGPACGRTLAAHGADVLLLNAPTAGNVPAFVLDTSHGKRSAFLDIDESPDALRALAGNADVFTQGYRPGALERRGFGAEELAELRPGLVYVSISCYGDVGPWRHRPGWEQLAQSASGIADAQGGDGPPALVPAAACDYTTGYLAALGAMLALGLRATEGGSYHVQASLCQTAAWIVAEGARCNPSQATGLPDLTPWMISSQTVGGTLEHLGPIVEMSATPPRWDRPSPPLGFDQPTWT
jgi:crotonobetainyl-CoA:carnitine CoA-transferase CaiB-like acyl-CoA transferase